MSSEEEDAIEEENEANEAKMREVIRRLEHCSRVFDEVVNPQLPSREYVCLIYDVVYGDRRVQIEVADN